MNIKSSFNALMLKTSVIALVVLCPAMLAGTITLYGVNDSGTIVGVNYNGTTYQAFTYNATTSTFTYLTPPGSTYSQAIGINDSGQIVGSYGNSTGNYGFLYSGGNYTTLSAPNVVQYLPSSLGNGGGTVAAGINNSGEIVGASANNTNPGQDEAGLTYNAGTYTTGFSDAGSSTSYTAFYGINDSGLISGYTVNVSEPGNVHAYTSFLYNGSTYLAIAYPGASSTIVQGVNNSGEAVGFYTLAGVTSGFIYDAGTYTSFMYRGADSTDLFGVSNSGEIVGDYTCASGTCPLSDPAFYAVPNGQGGYSVTTVNAPTPEPAGVLLLGGGLLAILASARSRTSKIFSNHN